MLDRRGAPAALRERRSPACDAPFAFVDLDALWANAADMLRRAARQADPRGAQVGALPARCSGTVLGATRLPGLLAFTLPEALWLADAGLRRHRSSPTRRRPRRAARARRADRRATRDGAPVRDGRLPSSTST